MFHGKIIKSMFKSQSLCFCFLHKVTLEGQKPAPRKLIKVMTLGLLYEGPSVNVYWESLGVPSPLCILELSIPIHIDMAVKNTTIFM